MTLANPTLSQECFKIKLRGNERRPRCQPYHTHPINSMIEARFDCLETEFERHTNILSEHDARLKEPDARLAKQDSILENSNKILETLKNTNCEHLGWSQTTHGITTACYFRWHGDDGAVDHLKSENM